MDLQLTIDCLDAAPMVAFWTVALDYEPAPPSAVGVTDRIHDPSGEGIRLWSRRLPRWSVRR